MLTIIQVCVISWSIIGKREDRLMRNTQYIIQVDIYLIIMIISITEKEEAQRQKKR